MTPERLSRAMLEAELPVIGVAIIDQGQRLVRVDFSSEPTLDQVATRDSVLASLDWSPDSQSEWEVQRAAENAGALLLSTDPIPQGVRVLERVQQNWANEQVRRIAVALQSLGYSGQLPEPLLESEMMASITAGLQSGLGLPPNS